ncbi:MAG: MFS transporter [Candidatus Baldrarchaeia archaeon]
MSEVETKPQPPVKPSILPIILLTISSFIGGAGFGIYAPLIPLHALELGAPPAIATATVMALPSILAVIVLLPASIYADKSGRRKELLIVALALATICNLLLGFARGWVELAIYRTISGLVFAFLSLYMAIGVLIAPPEKRGTVLAVLAGSGMLGMGVSQLFAGSLYSILGGYQPIYLLAAGLSLISLLLLLPVEAPPVKLPAMSLTDAGKVLRTRGVYWVAVSLFIYLCGWNLMYPSLSIILTEIYEAPVWIASIAFAVASIMLGAGTYIWGPIIDKIGGRKSLISAILASAIFTFVMIPTLGFMWAFIILFWIVTVFGVVGAPGSTYVATKSVKQEYASIATAVQFVFLSLASVIGGFAAGALLASLGLSYTLLIAAVIELVGGIMMFGVPEV